MKTTLTEARRRRIIYVSDAMNKKVTEQRRKCGIEYPQSVQLSLEKIKKSRTLQYCVLLLKCAVKPGGV